MPAMFLDDLLIAGWGWITGGGGNRLKDDIAGRFLGSPMLEDSVVVEVAGQPGANKQQLYFLALAAANGIVRRFGNLNSVVTPYGRIQIEYDAASNWVRATIIYKWSMLQGISDSIKAPSIIDQVNRMAVYRGPQCSVVGGTFDFATREAGDAAVFRLPTGIPTLPFEGQTILTDCPTVNTPLPSAVIHAPPPSFHEFGGPKIDSPNPKPPGDNRSRGAVLGKADDPLASFARPSENGAGSLSQANKCCNHLRFLIPLVYAALTSPATDSKTTYPGPKKDTLAS